MHKVLIADDESIIRIALSKLISWNTLDCEIVYQAENGLEAWEYMLENPVDIAILDIRMPGLNGLQLCSMLRQEGFDISVIILSAYSDYELMRDALQSNVCDYVMKSSFEVEMPKAIRKAIASANQIPNTKQPESGPLQPNAKYSEPVNQIIAYLRANYAERISVKEMADRMYLNQNYLCRLYKRQTGSTIIQDLTQYRLHQAKLRLKQGATIAQTAVECGFENAAYFTQVFTKNVGMSPGSWRRDPAENKE